MNQRNPRHFLDAEKISKHLHCSICHEVFDNPTRMRCGHTFCYECMFNWRKMTKNCPECKTKFIKWLPEKDLVAAHIIDDFMAKCSFGTCEWSGLYSGLKKHQRFCTFREKRQFDEVSGQEVVPVLDEPEDSEVQEIKNEQKHKKGKKKVKKSQQNNPGPQLPQSSQSAESINIQPLQPNRRSSSQPASNHESEGIPFSQNRSHIQSSSSDGYLETNLKKMFKKGIPQFKIQNQSQRMQYENDNEKNEEKQQQKSISRQLRDIGLDDEDQFRLYPRQEDDQKQKENRCRKRNRNGLKEESDYDDQQEFFRLLDYKNQQPQNLYLYKRRLEQEQRIRKQKQQQQARSRWNIPNPSSSRSKAEDSDSSNMSNPFDEPIALKFKNHPKIRQVIVLDSSDDNQVEMSRQSGEISEQLHNRPINKFNSDFTQIPDSNGDSPKEIQVTEKVIKKKDEVQKSMRQLVQEHMKRDSCESEQKKDKSKDETIEY